MATNKTRLIVSDGTATPNLISVVEFDVYQDAIDYAQMVCFISGYTYGKADCYVYVLSYDNTSYKIKSQATAPYFEATDAVFPADE